MVLILKIKNACIEAGNMNESDEATRTKEINIKSYEDKHKEKKIKVDEGTDLDDDVSVEKYLNLYWKRMNLLEEIILWSRWTLYSFSVISVSVPPHTFFWL